MAINVDWFYERLRLVKIFAKDVDVEEVAVCLPLEPKTAVLIYELSKYTNVLPAKLDDYSTKPEAVKWLEDRGIRVLRKRDVVDTKYFLDCAAVLSRIASKRRDFINVVELTKTGEDYLRSMNVKVRAISVDSSVLKGIGENIHGTAFGLLDALSRLNIYLPDKKVAIVGFGRVGKGCARVLQKLGCKVSVKEVSKVKMLEAKYEGFDVIDDLEDADIIVTCTGVEGVIRSDELETLKNGAILLNLGAEREIIVDLDPVADYGSIKKYKLNEKEFFLVSDGYAANLAVGYGTPIEIMDRTFSAAILALNYLKKDFEGVIPLPKEIEERIATSLTLQP